MPAGFLHIETYGRSGGRKWVKGTSARALGDKAVKVKSDQSISWVLDEAERLPHATPHVPNPKPPIIIHGCSVAELRALHDDLVGKVRLVTKDGRVRRPDQRQHTLLAGIASYPYAFGSDEFDQVEYDHFEKLNIRYLQDTFGDQLKGVHRHVDENKPHLHFFVLPGNKEMSAKDLHPGVVARQAAIAGASPGTDKQVVRRLGNIAYNQAMRALQDGYHQAVSMHVGLTRLGPGGRRLTGKEMRTEARIAREIAVALRQRDEAVAAAAQARALAAQAVEELNAIRALVVQAGQAFETARRGARSLTRLVGEFVAAFQQSPGIAMAVYPQIRDDLLDVDAELGDVPDLPLLSVPPPMPSMPVRKRQGMFTRRPSGAS